MIKLTRHVTRALNQWRDLSKFGGDIPKEGLCVVTKIWTRYIDTLKSLMTCISCMNPCYLGKEIRKSLLERLEPCIRLGSIYFVFCLYSRSEGVSKLLYYYTWWIVCWCSL